MSFKCVVCGKGPKSGNTISHSHRSTKRVFNPNLQRQRIVIDNVVRKSYVCTSCLRSGKVIKAI